jgi:Homeodomain-like domain
MHPVRSRREVAALIRAGHTDREISRRTGVPRPTVTRWRIHGIPKRRAAPPPAPNWRPSCPATYAYLLGLYLGDGCIWQFGQSAQLGIYLDSAYPRIVDDAELAICTVVPGCHVGRYVRAGSGAVRLQAFSPTWLVAFPQHGPGKKHQRRIELVGWQREVTHAHPRELDGCRTVNRFAVDLPRGGRRTYAYARYFFSNLSADIRGIFTEHCELLGIRWTLSNPRNVSVSHRRSVALLDEFVGAKT